MGLCVSIGPDVYMVREVEIAKRNSLEKKKINISRLSEVCSADGPGVYRTGDRELRPSLEEGGS